MAISAVYRQLEMMQSHAQAMKRAFPGWELVDGRLRCPNGNEAIWFATKQPGDVESQHAISLDADNRGALVLIRDECKSIDRDVMEASERFQPTWTINTSSAGGAMGWFYEQHTVYRHLIKCFRATAYQSSFVDKSWIEEMKAKYGESSPLFRSAVLAEFSQSDEGAFISLEAVQRCIRQPPGPAGREIVAGVDLSASDGGDESVIVVRRGNTVASIVAFRDSDAMRVAGRCIMALTDQRIPRGCVFADAGGLGVGIVDRMRELGWPVNGVHFGGSPLSADPRFGNRMTELWCRMKEEIEACRIALPNDDALIAQLTGRRAIVQSSGKIKLESKAEMKRRGLPSPDRADALALALLSPSSGRIRRTIPDSETKWEDRSRGMGGDYADGPQYAMTYGGTDLGGY